MCGTSVRIEKMTFCCPHVFSKMVVVYIHFVPFPPKCMHFFSTMRLSFHTFRPFMPVLLVMLLNKSILSRKNKTIMSLDAPSKPVHLCRKLGAKLIPGISYAIGAQSYASPRAWFPGYSKQQFCKTRMNSDDLGLTPSLLETLFGDKFTWS